MLLTWLTEGRRWILIQQNIPFIRDKSLVREKHNFIMNTLKSLCSIQIWCFCFLVLKIIPSLFYIWSTIFLYDYSLSLFSHRISTSIFDHVNLYIINHFLVVSLISWKKISFLKALLFKTPNLFLHNLWWTTYICIYIASYFYFHELFLLFLSHGILHGNKDIISFNIIFILFF